MEQVGAAALPAVIAGILIFAFVKGVDVFDTFLKGAGEGLSATIRVLPTLIGLILAVTMVERSGLLELICPLVSPVIEPLGISPQIAPLALLRPISGSGSSAFSLSLLKRFGPDSETGKIASVLSASTETTFYAVSVYFGACRYKKLLYTVPAALLGDMTAVILSIVTVKWFG